MPDLAASPHRATLPNCDGCGQFTSTPTVVDNSWHGGAGMYMCGELLLCPRCAAKAWDEGYAEGGRGRMWDSTNPYCWAEP